MSEVIVDMQAHVARCRAELEEARHAAMVARERVGAAEMALDLATAALKAELEARAKGASK